MTQPIRVAVVGGGMFFDEIIGPSLIDFSRGGIAGALSSIAMSHHAPSVAGIPIEFCAIGTHSEKSGTAGRIAGHVSKVLGNTGPKPYYGEKVWEEILENEKPDILVVATPDNLHTPAILAALEAGVDVVTEKPLCLTLSEADQIINKAANEQRIVGVDMHKRYDPFVRHMMTHSLKKYGPINRVRAVLEEPLAVSTEVFAWAEKSNPFTYVGCHWLDVVEHYMKVRPVALYATGEKNLLANWDEYGPLIAAQRGKLKSDLKKQGPIKTWDSMNVNITYDNGMRGDYNNAWINPEEFEAGVNQEIEVYGIMGRGMVDQQDRGFRETITGDGSRTRNPAFGGVVESAEVGSELFGYGKASLAACFLAILRRRRLGKTVSELKGTYPSAAEQRWITMILESAAIVAQKNFDHSMKGEGAPVTARFSEEGFEVLDPLG
ncbi:MAG: Gfo/Idh/MocA family oxidoreductase [Candidatus Omnitrophica bacterium]|nr:Gfo/Idh/MocA family oxidoreductase [Candidatus Omnitrophota bacterium]MCB9783551.1 Gfo/Idh/MocA family oxidoreductase [Candidatus Omnitrophota bacterium]